MKLTIPVCVLRAFTASVLSIAAPVAIATLAPASALQAAEPIVNIVATNATTGYQEAPGVFTITLSEKQDKPVTILYSIKKSRAENGVDYKRLSGMKVIKAGKTHATIQVVPTSASDGVSGFGPVDLTLRKGDGYKLGPDKKASVEITIVLP
jgi:hypothetical protein